MSRSFVFAFALVVAPEPIRTNYLLRPFGFVSAFPMVAIITSVDLMIARHRCLCAVSGRARRRR